jgi:hypothetical protein
MARLPVNSNRTKCVKAAAVPNPVEVSGVEFNGAHRLNIRHSSKIIEIGSRIGISLRSV